MIPRETFSNTIYECKIIQETPKQVFFFRNKQKLYRNGDIFFHQENPKTVFIFINKHNFSLTGTFFSSRTTVTVTFKIQKSHVQRSGNKILRKLYRRDL